MRFWNRAERWLIGVIGIAALALAAYQMISRYGFPDAAITWSEEVVVYLLIAAAFLSGSLLVEEDGHVRADLVLRILPPGMQRAVEIGNCVIALAFCIGLTWLGFGVALDAYELGERSLSALAFPMWLYYTTLPFGAALMSLRYLRRLYRYLCRYDAHTMAVQSGHES